MKDAYYFSHDSNARNDQRIIKLRRKLGAEGYGIYFMLIEILRDQVDYRLGLDDDILENISYDLRVDMEKVEAIVLNYELFHIDRSEGMPGYFYSVSLTRRMEKLDLIKLKRAEAGRKGGKVKPNDNQMLNKSLTSRVKNNKEKKSKVKESKIKTLDSIESNGSITLIQYFGKCFKDYFGNDYHANFGKDGKLLKLLSDQYGDDRVRRGIQYFFKTYLVQDEFAMENPNVGTLSIKWNSMIAKSSGKKALTKQQKKIQSSIENILEVDLD